MAPSIFVLITAVCIQYYVTNVGSIQYGSRDALKELLFLLPQCTSYDLAQGISSHISFCIRASKISDPEHKSSGIDSSPLCVLSTRVIFRPRLAEDQSAGALLHTTTNSFPSAELLVFTCLTNLNFISNSSAGIKQRILERARFSKLTAEPAALGGFCSGGKQSGFLSLLERASKTHSA